ncbi:calcium-binding protein CML42-like [Magnolia sinica]|uniref:calcium-binding protein CML42-like n=1 Tax=Magnolia sinica TaxID=86752 RepID=UPI002657DDC0|nr:calcium-binding protein CML42-like [Magnolia sinica]
MAQEPKPSLTRASHSFRLRSSSLNSLRLRRIFDVFDRNADGMITAQELGRALEQLGLEVEPIELECIVQLYVKPGNSGLEYDDFEALHRSLGDSIFSGGNDDACTTDSSSAQEESDLTEAFKVFDEDGDGFISARELQAVLGKLGFPEGRDINSVEQMICSVDRNHDGLVDFHEFKDMMQSVSIMSI